MKDRLFNKNFVLLTIINLVIFSIVGVFVSKINSIYDKFILKLEDLKVLEQKISNYLKVFDGSDYYVCVYIKDLTTDHEIKLNSDLLIPSASLVKIPIMAAVYYLAEKGDLSLDEMLVYKKRHRCGGSGIVRSFRYGSKFTVRQLMEWMITVSDNVATHMLIERISIRRLNEIFKNLGLDHTNIDRYVMDLNSRDKGTENYTTAKDMAVLLEKIYKGNLVSKKASLEMLSYLLKQQVINRIPARLPESVVVANKTGTMKNVYHDVGIVYTKTGNFIICVLTQNIAHKLASRIISNIAYETYLLYDRDKNINVVTNNNFKYSARVN